MDQFIEEQPIYENIYQSESSMNKPKEIVFNTCQEQIFLTSILTACEAIVACRRQLDIMDQYHCDGHYGVKFACAASVIQNAIKDGDIIGSKPSITFYQISSIMANFMAGRHGRLYSLFFDAASKIFCDSRGDSWTGDIWLEALIAGTNAISDNEKESTGICAMLNTLIAAQNNLINIFNEKENHIDAFGDAVTAAEKFARGALDTSTHLHNHENPDPGAHAVGIWMRAAYEGVKLTMAYQNEYKSEEEEGIIEIDLL